MMKRFFVGICIACIGMWTFALPTFGLSFKFDFVAQMLNGGDNSERVYNLTVDRDKTIFENIQELFYPSEDAENSLRRLIRNITIGVFFAFLVYAGIKFLLFAANDEAELKSAWRNLIYLFYGWALIFLSIWILWTILDLWSIEWLWWGADVDSENGIVRRVATDLMIFVLSFLKALAFFMAIIFLIYYGYRMMLAFDEEEKLKTAQTGILNVILALILIKVIDYIYYIVQLDNFQEEAWNLIVQVSKILLWIGGAMFVIAVIYAWFLMLTSSGNEESINKAKTILKTVFIIILIIFLFMLIIYQVVGSLT